MRLFYFLLLLSTSLYAQIDTGDGSDGACVDATIINGGVLQCASLTISAAFPGVNAGAPALDIRVQGDVDIAANISLNGSPGNDTVVFGGLGGVGGPGGGGNGGQYNAGVVEDAPGTSGGKKGTTDPITCGSGGGGGGFVFAGTAGIDCGASPGGAAGPLYGAILTGALRGGFGGGSGGDGPSITVGTGGGGGGAIRIRAGGNVIIDGDISADGGQGGDSNSDGGGGGGGSGGLIWIQALGEITNNGTMTANAGAGGSGAPTGSDGSAGSVGMIRLEDLDGAVDGAGTHVGAIIVPVGGAAAAASNSLKSSISCGTTKSEESNSSLFQIAMGFILMLVAGEILKYRRSKFSR